MSEKRLHSICRWTFNSGKGGFVPGNVRPSWSSDSLSTERIPALIAKEISPRLPDHIELGFELHYDNEVNESNAVAVAEALQESGLHLAMITPGAHTHFGYGGIASLCPEERQQSRIFGEKNGGFSLRATQVVLASGSHAVVCTLERVVGVRPRLTWRQMDVRQPKGGTR
ncbi:hypothetical protein QM565_12940 [Geitlerinema splendidum]|nr:hypothetical protein [Geitlerinema splendidum]